MPLRYLWQGSRSEVDTKSFHLARQPAPEGILKGVIPKGEFHEPAQPAPEVLLAGVAPTDEIHLKRRCTSEVPVKGVSPKGEFHEITQPASEALLAGLAPTGEMASEALLPRSEGPWGIELPRALQAWQKFGQARSSSSTEMPTSWRKTKGKE